jgi:hypothetical protein
MFGKFNSIHKYFSLAGLVICYLLLKSLTQAVADLET